MQDIGEGEGVSKEEKSDYWVAEGEKYWSESDKTVQSALKALEFIDKAITINPLNYKAWSDKGFLLKQMGEYDSAVMCLDRAISLKNHKSLILLCSNLCCSSTKLLSHKSSIQNYSVITL